MPKAKVFFAPFEPDGHKSFLIKIDRLYQTAFSKIAAAGDSVAVKVHVGEAGSHLFLPAAYVQPVIRQIKGAGGKPFLTDTATLYHGQRVTGSAHQKLAAEHGYGPAIGADFVAADGETGGDFAAVSVGLKHFSEVKIAAAIWQAGRLISCAHFTGHTDTGFGGTLKNLGMGCASRAGKQMMHSEGAPPLKQELCTGCGACQEVCLVKAIKIENQKARIDPRVCIACGQCLVVCPSKAVGISWEIPGRQLQERIAEFAAGALKNKKGRAGFFNFLINITPECDCWPFSSHTVVPDLGVLASTDPVAIDQAALDLVNQSLPNPAGLAKNHQPGQDLFQQLYPELDPHQQLAYAEKIGLGSRGYELINVGRECSQRGKIDPRPVL